jgi:hypothetical protein
VRAGEETAFEQPAPDGKYEKIYTHEIGIVLFPKTMYT